VKTDHQWADGLLPKIRALRPMISAGSDISVHTLLCHQHLVYYLFSIKTFLTFSGLLAQVFVYDDGTLSCQDRQILLIELPGVKIIPASTIRTAGRLRCFPNCAQFLKQHVLAPKLLAVHEFGCTNRMILLDSDVLFLKRPAEIVAWCCTNSTIGMYAADLSRDESVSLHSFEFEQAGSQFVPNFNSGLLCITPHHLDLDLVEKTLPVVHGRVGGSRWLEEQTLWAVLVGRIKSCVLPESYSMRGSYKSNHTVDLSTSICVHYSYPKAQFFSEGVRHLITRKLL
jgi:hypothetical protein